VRLCCHRARRSVVQSPGVHRVVPTVCLLAVALVIGALVGCSSSAEPDGAAGTSSTGLSVAGSPEVDPPLVRSVACSEASESVDSVPDSYAVVEGSLALPTADASVVALQTWESPDTAFRLWTKVGVLVTTNQSVEIEVPAELRGQIALRWGVSADQALGML